MYSNTLRKWKKDLAYYWVRYESEKKNDSPENLDWKPNLDLSHLWAAKTLSDIGDIRDFEMEIELTNKVLVSEP